MPVVLDPHQEKAVEFVLQEKKAALFMGGDIYADNLRSTSNKCCRLYT